MAGLDPVTARAGLRTAREIISGRQISYPIPYILGIFCASAIACFIIALFAADSVRAVTLGAGLLALIAAITAMVVAIFVRPELLRSERHEQVMRMLDLAGDKDTTPEVRGVLGQTLVTMMEPRTRDIRGNKEDNDE